MPVVIKKEEIKNKRNKEAAIGGSVHTSYFFFLRENRAVLIAMAAATDLAAKGRPLVILNHPQLVVGGGGVPRSLR